MDSHCYINQTLQNKTFITEEYKLSNEFKIYLKSLPVPFVSDISQCTYYRTYSRLLENGGKERWADTIIRVTEGTISAYLTHMKKNFLQIKENLDDFAKELCLSAFNRQWAPPGRGLFAMGTDLIKYKGNAALNNCYAVSTKDNLVKSAAWAMDMLSLGGGVGLDLTWKGEIRNVNKEDYIIYTIPDTREGWVSSLELLLRSYIPIDGVITNKFPKFDYSLIRPLGSPIKTFGGTASGPEPLRVLLTRVEAFCESYISNINNICLEDIYEEQIRFLCKNKAYFTTHEPDVEREVEQTLLSVSKFVELKQYNEIRFIADLFNSIASCICAGNVRRSSQILIGDVSNEKDCQTFINLKNFEVNPERSPFSWNSNNTVRFTCNEDFEKWIPILTPLIKQNGEPGILNLINFGKYGRFADTSRPYDDATLINPCGEINLCSYEPCTLSIICPYNCRTDMSVENSPLDEDKLFRAAEFATFYASTVTLISSHWAESNAIIAKNRRIGVDMSGVTNIYENYGQNFLITMARKLYHHVDDINKEFTEKAGVRRSIRITTIKPNGTSSLIAELNPGIHFALMKYCIRRINVSSDSPLINAFQNAGYSIEDSLYTPNTKVICIPLYSGNGREAEQVSVFEQFGLLMSMQRHWADNSISDTITFNKETEGSNIDNAISMFIPYLKTVSLLGKESSGSISGYKQLPYEKISKDDYEIMMSKLTSINWNYLYDFGKDDGIIPKFCTNDVCELK